MRSSYTEHAVCFERATQPYSIGGGGGGLRFVQAQDQQVVTTRSPRIIIECLLSRSMLIKMYVHAIYSWFCIETILSNRKLEYEFIATITIKFDESFRSWLSSSDFLMLNTLVFFTYLDVYARFSIVYLTLSSDRRTILAGRGPHLAMNPSPGEILIRMNIIFTPMNHLKQLSQYEWFLSRTGTPYRKCRKVS